MRNTSRSLWSVLGVILGVVLALIGVATLGAAVLFVVAMNSYGSNK